MDFPFEIEEDGSFLENIATGTEDFRKTTHSKYHRKQNMCPDGINSVQMRTNNAMNTDTIRLSDMLHGE